MQDIMYSRSLIAQILAPQTIHTHPSSYNTYNKPYEHFHFLSHILGSILAWNPPHSDTLEAESTSKP